MISVSNLGVHFGQQVLFSDVNFQLNEGNRYGLVGANGSGKSTLLKVLMNRMQPEEGEVNFPSSIRIGFLEQDHFAYEEEKILDVVLMGKKELWKAMEEKRDLLESPELCDEKGSRLGELEMTIADHNGYEAEMQCAELLSGLGILEKQHLDQLNTLSGGYKLRVLLAQCLFSEPDFLLLDEPTNHLDLGSIHWLEEYLCRFPGTSLVISHDQHFLNRICSHIIDIDYETIKIYTGNYVQFLASKQLEREQKETEIERQEKKKEELQQFIDRFKAKATKARQANSKSKQLEKMDDIVIKRSSRLSPNFDFQMVRPTGKEVIKINNLCKSFGEKRVLKDISLSLMRGRKIAVIGPNGIGKSTLLKIIMGELEATSGEAEFGHEVAPGYFSQDHHDLIPDNSSPYEWLYGFSPGETIGTIRGLLARVLLVGDDVHKATQSLSGGEAGRLIFSKLMLEKPNLLLLDEPTNHMDIETIEALSEALVKYEGTIVCVSHDRSFIESFATDILELTHEGFEYFSGSYLEYLERQGTDYLDRTNKQPAAQAKQYQPAPVAPTKTLSGKEQHKNRKEINRLERLVKNRESKVSDLEDKITEYDSKLEDNTLYDQANKGKLDQVLQEKEKLENDLEVCMEEWEKAQEELEALQAL